MSKFSKQHYEVIAKTIRESNDKNALALKLAEIFQTDNDRFSFKRFAKACGITL